MVKKKSLKYKNILTFLIALGVILAVNFIASKKYARIDLTEDDRFTLTEASENVVKKLDDVVEFKVYLEGENLPAKYVEFREEIKSRLEEFRNLNPEFVEYEFIDPHAAENPDEFVASLRKKGLLFTNDVEKTENGVNQIQIIPGILVYYKGKSYPINLLKSDIRKSIESIEYELVAAIKILTTTFQNRKNVGLLQGHGELFPEEVADLSSSIVQFYNPAIVRLRDSMGRVDIKNLFLSDILIIAKPDPRAPFSEGEIYALDQYVMRGGKIIWMLDQVSADEDSLRDRSFFVANINKLGTEDLLYHYGVRVNNNLLQDLQCSVINATVGVEANGQPKNQLIPWFYAAVVNSQNNHIINKNIDPIRLNFANTIDTIPSAGITKTVLLASSNSSKILKAPVRVGIDGSVKALQEGVDKTQFKDSQKPIAVLLEGSFDSYYKNRIPPAAPFEFIKKSQKSKMIVISDGDIARNKVNPYTGAFEPLGMDRKAQYFFDNKKFLMNALNYLSGDEDLIPARCKRIEIRLLDRGLIKEKKKLIQAVNVLIPVLLIVIAGLLYNFLRTRKYTRK